MAPCRKSQHGVTILLLKTQMEPCLQQGIVKYSIIFDKIKIFHDGMFTVLQQRFSNLSSSCRLLLINEMVGSSTVLQALTVFISVFSASAVPISERKTNKLHFFSGNCSDPEVQRQIKKQFIKLLNDSVFNEVCQADTLRNRCKADNVKVTCYSDSRRRRSLSGESKGSYLLCFLFWSWKDQSHCEQTFSYKFYSYSNFKQSWSFS